MLDPDQLLRLSQMGPVAFLIALLCLFAAMLVGLWRRKREAFAPALLSGALGVLIGGGAMVAAVRILNLHVLSERDIDRIVRNSNRGGGGQWRRGRERAYRGGRSYRLGEERYKLAMFVRVIDQLTEQDPAFLDDKQAASILSMLEVIMPMAVISDREAAEMLADIDDRLRPEQRARVREMPLPRDPGIWSGTGRLLDNPFHSRVNADAIVALQKRYEHVKRATIAVPNLLDL